MEEKFEIRLEDAAVSPDTPVEVVDIQFRPGQKIYFFDPNGHRVELACPDPEEEAMLERLNTVKWEMLEEWSRTRKAPRHADWMHQKELQGLD